MHNQRDRKAVGGVGFVPHKHDERRVLSDDGIMDVTGVRVGIRRALPTKRDRFIENEQESEEQDQAAEPRESKPHIGLSFSTSVIVFCKRIIVLWASATTSYWLRYKWKGRCDGGKCMYLLWLLDENISAGEGRDGRTGTSPARGERDRFHVPNSL